MEIPEERINAPDERTTITRGEFMYVALGYTDAETAVKIWRAAGGAHDYDLNPEVFVDPEDPVMDDEIDLVTLYERMRAAEKGDAEAYRLMSSPPRWNTYTEVINTYLGNGAILFLPWDAEIHTGIRHKNESRRLGAVALLESAYDYLDSQA